jgi:hypothetical protein
VAFTVRWGLRGRKTERRGLLFMQHLLPFISCASKIKGHAPPTPAEMKAVSFMERQVLGCAMMLSLPRRALSRGQCTPKKT